MKCFSEKDLSNQKEIGNNSRRREFVIQIENKFDLHMLPYKNQIFVILLNLGWTEPRSAVLAEFTYRGNLEYFLKIIIVTT